MLYGILAGVTWAVETVILGVALAMTPFVSPELDIKNFWPGTGWLIPVIALAAFLQRFLTFAIIKQSQKSAHQRQWL